MKRYIKTSSSTYTDLEEARQIIDSIPMTKGRRNSLYNIQEWNVSPEDVKELAGGNGGIAFQSSWYPVVSISYGPENPRADKTFIFEFENGARSLYGWKYWTSSYSGETKADFMYLRRI